MFNFENTNLFVGTLKDNNNLDKNDWAVVHATQTIHYQILGWNRTYNKPDKSHPNYIIYEEGPLLSLNWVDGPAYLYKWGGIDVFIRVLDFIDKWIPEKKVLIHCDQGYSRSPSLCLLYLAKRKGFLPNSSYSAAKTEFIKLYPSFNPGGIENYINQNWMEIK